MNGKLLIAVIWAGVCSLILMSARAQDSDFRVAGDRVVNARACPQLDCAIIATLEPGTTVQVIGTVTGDEVFGSSEWWRVNYDGAEAYLHSALLEPVPESGTSTLSNTAASTDDWVEHQIAGIRIKTPPDWQDATEYHTRDTAAAEDKSAQAMHLSVFQKSSQDLPAPNNHVIFIDPVTVASVEVWASYTGIDVSLTATKPFLENQLESLGQNLVSSQIVSLPAGDAVRLQTQLIYDSKNPSPLYDDERVLYYLASDRVEYSIYLTARQIIFEDIAGSLEAIARSFEIQSSEAARAAVIQDAGSARAGENPGQMTEGWIQLWTFEGEAGDLINIRAIAAPGTSNDLDPYLLVRAPNGRIIAENDDSGLLSLNTNPHIRRLELPESGTYEIEVHAYDGFAGGAYTLTIESGAAQSTPEPTGSVFTDNNTFM